MILVHIQHFTQAQLTDRDVLYRLTWKQTLLKFTNALTIILTIKSWWLWFMQHFKQIAETGGVWNNWGVKQKRKARKKMDRWCRRMV